MPKATKMMAAAYGAPDQMQPYEVDVPEPGPGEVTIDVRAAGVNPADYKAVAGNRGRDEANLPLPIGFEVAGVVSAAGPDTGFTAGDEVLAFRVRGGYTSAITVPAKDVFAKPEALDFPEAANLLLAACTAADMLRVVPVEPGQTVVVHGASGAVGVSLLQQLAPLGVRAIGTASEHSFDSVRRFGGEPVAYGDGLEARLRELAPDGVDGAFDCVGTDEAVDTSLALVGKDRLVTIAAAGARPETRASPPSAACARRAPPTATRSAPTSSRWPRAARSSCRWRAPTRSATPRRRSSGSGASTPEGSSP